MSDESRRFHDRFRALVQELGCTGWNIEYCTRDMQQPGTRAAVYVTYVDRLCTVTWNTGFDPAAPDIETPEFYAEHEVLHLLFWDMLEAAAGTRSSCSALTQAQEHSVILRLQKFLSAV